jgi:hypothetical protein
VNITVSIVVTIDRTDGSNTQISQTATTAHGDNPRFERNEAARAVGWAVASVTARLGDEQ